jgi:hypothetical protein
MFSVRLLIFWVLVMAIFGGRAGAELPAVSNLSKLGGGEVRQASRPHFDWRRETIAFSNDTVFAYGIDEAGRLTIHRRETPARFAHRCFVLARAVLQFHKFARFAPEEPRATEGEYRELIPRVCRVPVWMPARSAEQRIVIPGYRDLNEFSRAHEHVMKETMGNWFPTYLRVGNWRMIGPFPRFGQANAYGQIVRGLDRGKLQAVYLTRFPKMNHCVILFDYLVLDEGKRTRFDAYDPNYPNTLSWVEYAAGERSFDFERRWFWPGGRVNLMRVYISPVH